MQRQQVCAACICLRRPRRGIEPVDDKRLRFAAQDVPGMKVAVAEPIVVRKALEPGEQIDTILSAQLRCAFDVASLDRFRSGRNSLDLLSSRRSALYA